MVPIDKTEFAWGASMVSTQIEGAAPSSDWARWERDGRLPPSGSGNDFATEYATDLALLAHQGVTDLRITLEWARVEPQNGQVDQAEIERYRQILAIARELGLRVWACLVDRTLPGWFSLDERGFRDKKARGYYWPRHVDLIGEQFSDLVDVWVPIVDPVLTAATGYLGGSAPPGRTDPDMFRRALLGMHLGLYEAWRVLRGSRPVATCHDLSPTYAQPSTDPEARAAANVADGIWWNWLTSYRDGELELPGTGPIETPGLVEAFDIIGFTYRGALSVDANGDLNPHPPDDKIGPLGDVAWNEGLGLAIRRLAEDGPERPLVLLGHTLATGEPEQDYTLVGQALDEVTAARHEGIDIRGYFHTPGIAGYDWHHANLVDHGLFDRARRPLPVAELFAERTTPPG